MARGYACEHSIANAMRNGLWAVGVCRSNIGSQAPVLSLARPAQSYSKMTGPRYQPFRLNCRQRAGAGYLDVNDPRFARDAACEHFFLVCMVAALPPCPSILSSPNRSVREHLLDERHHHAVAIAEGTSWFHRVSPAALSGTLGRGAAGGEWRD